MSRFPSRPSARRTTQAKKQPAKEQVIWHHPARPPFRLSGFAWYQQDRVYRRLPVKPAEPLPQAVDALANNTSGGQVSFTTNSRMLKLNVELAGAAMFDHMAPTGVCGFDVYIGQPGRQHFGGVTRFNLSQSAYEAFLFQNLKPSWRTVTINFPLYQGVRKLRIGLEPSARIKAPPPFAHSHPVVIYGTSITQGGCASRPGMAYTSILSRRLNVELINLGFSGSGQAEPEVARMMASIPNPALLAVDCEANCSDAILRGRLPKFIGILRAAHPKTPILLISRIRFARDLMDPNHERQRKKRQVFQRQLVEQMRRKGDRHIHFIDGLTLLGADGEECTVDGVHATDLGFFRIAGVLEPVIRRLL